MPTLSHPLNPINRSQKANVGCLTAFAAMTLRLGQSSSAELQCASECPPLFAAPFYTIGHSLLSACVKEGGRSTILPAPSLTCRLDAHCTLTFSSFLCVRQDARARSPPQSAPLRSISQYETKPLFCVFHREVSVRISFMGIQVP